MGKALGKCDDLILSLRTCSVRTGLTPKSGAPDTMLWHGHSPVQTHTVVYTHVHTRALINSKQRSSRKVSVVEK